LGKYFGDSKRKMFGIVLKDAEIVVSRSNSPEGEVLEEIRTWNLVFPDIGAELTADISETEAEFMRDFFDKLGHRQTRIEAGSEVLGILKKLAPELFSKIENIGKGDRIEILDAKIENIYLLTDAKLRPVQYPLRSFTRSDDDTRLVAYVVGSLTISGDFRIFSNQETIEIKAASLPLFGLRKTDK